ncbi:sulfatase family protein [Nibricoccus aquaticus]|uniref:sulfatase family protein n=1 Tax=Nibricoccus aquaticus TaxID=2576891 RepID=UPI001C310B73|nr:sulfatase [Nibricoccus aquaticus]
MVLLTGLCGISAASATRPNIVLIVSDDHGTDALGCYGNPVIKTPNLDALAADGTRFTDAFCTSASCSPSRAVILSGRQNHRNGMYGLEHDESHFSSFANVRSLPVVLAESGYRTARVGKFHVAPDSVYSFQTVLSQGAANDPATIGRSPVEMAELARGVIEKKDEKPFFLYYATDDPHRANAVLPNGKPTFETYPEPNSFGNRKAGYTGITPVTYRPDEVIVPPFLPDTPVARAELAQYYQAVSRLDQGVGRLIEILKKSGQYENTLIIYISDNGAAFPNAKTTLYDSGMKLPCIIRSPGRARGGVTQDAMITWADIMPTLLDVAGISLKNYEMDGRSFRAALAGARVQGWDEIFASHTFHQITMYYPMRVVRTRDYKLIYNLASGLTFPSARDLIQSPTWISVVREGGTVIGRRTIEQYLHRPQFELYDLKKDPDEIVNLADDPALQTVKAGLIEKLKAFQAASKDPWISKWNYE